MSNVADVKLHQWGWRVLRDGELLGMAFNLDRAKALARQHGCRVRIVREVETIHTNKRPRERKPLRQCKVPGCGKYANRWWYCETHWAQTTVDDIDVPNALAHKCAVNSCRRLRVCRGLCHKHIAYVKRVSEKAGQSVARWCDMEEYE